MTRYFFHVRDGDDLVEDTEGVELWDSTSAREEAIRAAREMLAEKLLSGERVDGELFEVTDESGRVVETIPFKSVMKI
ncbi:DUF6894 family protein [Rhizobium mesoamericanum]|uniref:DUF6894 domain-containing protein n=1 Tax=Rhizobium mesoamericanum STM3625 TaxID=1211777 RepID=K0PVF4_9HYPH|nr:hypothetical protein [Rhizobium mesoamericanum]CCM75127.1 conserved hypothetical protein [Rhizobium mesoamericanum STM3625]